VCFTSRTLYMLKRMNTRIYCLCKSGLVAHHLMIHALMNGDFIEVRPRESAAWIRAIPHLLGVKKLKKSDSKSQSRPESQ
jgi:hypothetical protein